MEHVRWARDLAQQLLSADLPRRWKHTQGVAQQADSLRGLLGEETDMVVAAAWLHDVGYSPGLATTGFHPLDGARFLRAVESVDEHLCSLVAHHSGAVVEAEERGLVAELLGEFDLPRVDLLNALTYCDMTTGPDGAHVPADQRLSEILERYHPTDLVHRAITRSASDLMDAVHDVQERFAAVT